MAPKVKEDVVFKPVEHPACGALPSREQAMTERDFM